MAKKATAASFLKNMGLDEAEPEVPSTTAGEGRGKGKPVAVSRAELKHFGGYIGTEVEEQIAILRARLKLDNSKLIERAIRELYDREESARKFGDR